MLIYLYIKKDKDGEEDGFLEEQERPGGYFTSLLYGKGGFIRDHPYHGNYGYFINSKSLHFVRPSIKCS